MEGPTGARRISAIDDLGDQGFPTKGIVPVMDTQVRTYFDKNLKVLCCPKCQGEFVMSDDCLICSLCHHQFEVRDNIPLLFWPNEWDPSKSDVTDTIKAFYEKSPFPDYDDFDSVGTLVRKAREGLFAKLLDDQIPSGTRILECGCGTGQLSAFLSIANRTVFATDICLNSLRLGQQFTEKNNLQRVHFIQMNLFRPVFKSELFDLVICNGVLHHTSDPFLGFQSIAKLVKRNRYILIGLYHRYGRTITRIRRSIFRVSGDRFTWLDPNLRNTDKSVAKKRAWFMDQYKNPHESTHTIGDVLRWFKETGFAFVKSLPNSVPFQRFSECEKLFERERPGSWLERLVTEMGMIATGNSEGGFFVVIGKKL